MPRSVDTPFPDTFDSLLACLRRFRVRHAVIGALAVAVWGTSRATQDIDCLVMLRQGEHERLVNLLRRRGFMLDAHWAGQNPMLKGLCMRFRHGGIPVDLLLATDSHHMQALKRRRLKRVNGKHVWVLAPEDLILMKLRAGRYRDFDDVLSIVSEQKKIDHAYLKQWAKQLGLWEEVMYCLTQSKPPAL